MEESKGIRPPDFAALAAAALYPKGAVVRSGQELRIHHMVMRRDPLTEIQQRLITAALNLLRRGEDGIVISDCVQVALEEVALIMGREAEAADWISEIEKLGKKGVWISEPETRRLARTQWFQTLEYGEDRLNLRFSGRMLEVIQRFAPANVEQELVKGLQYKGKHTLAVHDIIWRWRNQGLVEYSISQLMELLSLENTRYSYGQLKLRVLEPALEEIYEWDDTIFLRFGPTFSGRRVEGVWFEAMTGEPARELRQKQPEFKFSRPEEKPR